ncbi:ogr/Delta-like zinc finger family protein [Rugamonas sp. A1-17]|nr:ogr/Delta-like zinc finger family protein [Rugamonas sp. A1-17]
MSVKMKCPHCEAKAVARALDEISNTVSEIIFQCDDPYCGHTFVARLEVMRTTTPPKKEKAVSGIPLSPKSKHGRAELNRSKLAEAKVAD